MVGICELLVGRGVESNILGHFSEGFGATYHEHIARSRGYLCSWGLHGSLRLARRCFVVLRNGIERSSRAGCGSYLTPGKAGSPSP